MSVQRWTFAERSDDGFPAVPHKYGYWVSFDDHQSSRAEDKQRIAILEAGYRVYKDGNSWCAVGPRFTNLQESKAGFGASPLEALGDLIVQEGE